MRPFVWGGVGIAMAAIFYFVVVPWISANLFKSEVSVTEISMVSPAQAQIELTAVGHVVPQIVSHVRAKIVGLVTKVHVQRGDHVQAGDVLLTLERIEQETAASAHDDLTVRTPIAGTVISKPPQQGQRVGAHAPGFDIADFSTLAVETEIPVGQLPQVRLGSPCEIVLDAHPSRRFRGSILEISPRVNVAKAAVRIKVSFTDSAAGVFPEMSARVSLLSKEIETQAIQEPPKLIVPSSAITKHEGAKVVFVIESGKARMKTVTLGAPFGDGFELTSGPPAGARVVKNPPDDMRDGQRVREKSL